MLPIKLPYGSWMEKKLHLNRELKQRRRRRLLQRHLKSECALLQTLSRLFQLVQFVKCLQFFPKLDSKTVSKFRKRKRSRCLVFTSSTKCHVAVVQRQQRNVQKSVTQVQSCCYASLNLLLFCRSRCHRRCRCLSSLVKITAYCPTILPVKHDIKRYKQ